MVARMGPLPNITYANITYLTLLYLLVPVIVYTPYITLLQQTLPRITTGYINPTEFKRT